MRTHTVVQGECFSSLAHRYGFLMETLWRHPGNAKLRETRQDPNVLYPGDVVTIPDRELREEPRPTDQRHKFVKEADRTKLRIRLMDGARPRSHVPYRLEVDGTVTNGTTDGAGFLDHPIPSDARRGSLVVGQGPTKDLFEWQFGTVDPIDTDEGVRGRLIDLGFASGDTDDMLEAIKAFQESVGLTVTGRVDAATRSRLTEQFGQ